MGKNFEAGNYDLIPHQVFEMNDIKAALDLMKTGKHVGKVVLSNYTKTAAGGFEPLAVTVEKPQQVFHANASYLVTGGAGGFGSAMVRYAFDHGAKHFLITTRSADTEKVGRAAGQQGFALLCFALLSIRTAVNHAVALTDRPHTPPAQQTHPHPRSRPPSRTSPSTPA